MTPLLLTALLACTSSSDKTATDDSSATTDATGCPDGMEVSPQADLSFDTLTIDDIPYIVTFNPSKVYEGVSSSCIDTRTGGRAQLTFVINDVPFGTVYTQVDMPGSYDLSDTTNSFRIVFVDPPVQYDNGPAQWESGTWTTKLSPLDITVNATAASKSHNVVMSLTATVPKP